MHSDQCVQPWRCTRLFRPRASVGRGGQLFDKAALHPGGRERKGEEGIMRVYYCNSCPSLQYSYHQTMAVNCNYHSLLTLLLALFPGLLTPAFVACSTTNAGVRRPGNEARDSMDKQYQQCV